MFSVMTKKLIRVFQLFLVVLFIVFEELIWEGIARPIYTYIHSLKILQRVEQAVQRTNPSAILFIFVVLFVFVEAVGIYAGALFVSGKAVAGIALYAAKIPVAALTFWLFRVSEGKLMQFGWFEWSYTKIMAAIDWIKSTEIYLQTIAHAKTLKETIKQRLLLIRQNYFGQESSFVSRLKHLYRAVKAALKKNKT